MHGQTTRRPSPSEAQPAPVRSKSASAPSRAPAWSWVLQPKLRVGAVDDPLEREADRVTEAVVSGSAAPATVQRKCAACEEEEKEETVHRSPAELPAEDEEEKLQTKRSAGTAPEVSPKTASRIASFRGGGDALSPAAKAYFEPHFGRDLSAVRLHTGGAAARAAGEVQARAFTVGSNIAFAAGEYRPETQEGKRLLAHELTHTVQQQGGSTLRRDPKPKKKTPELTEKDVGEQTDTSGAPIPKSFVQKVYKAQVAIWKAAGATYTHEVPSGDRKSLATGDVISGRTVTVHRDIFDPLTRLLAQARKDLAADQAAGTATDVAALAVRSGYRSAPEQMTVWETEFKNYYDATKADRQDPAKCPGGEHGQAAAELLARYINSRVFSPGYSPHQKGKTIDFSYQSKTDWPKAAGNWAKADTSTAGIATWNASWFFKWLSKNAAGYGFHQNPALNEPWHWEWQPPAKGGGLLDLLWRLILLIIEYLRALLRWLGGGAESPATEEAPPPEDGGTEEPR
jgi:uncharacterized protein DUF4157/D-alanyl-D-alanine carboxypeptidase-like protein